MSLKRSFLSGLIIAAFVSGYIEYGHYIVPSLFGLAGIHLGNFSLVAGATIVTFIAMIFAKVVTRNIDKPSE